MADQTRKPTVVDRTSMDLRLRGCRGIRQIACAPGRSAAAVSDQVNRNGGHAPYDAGAAECRAAAKRDLTGRKPEMVHDGPLFTRVARRPGLGWSPEQVSGKRKRQEARLERPSGLRVSHEAI